MGEFPGSMAGGHGDIGETFFIKAPGDILPFDIPAEVRIYVQGNVAQESFRRGRELLRIPIGVRPADSWLEADISHNLCQ